MKTTTDLPSYAETTGQASRCYPFPRRFIYIEMISFSFVSTLMIFAWIPALISLFTYGMVLASALRAAIFLNFTAGCIILSIVFVKREMRYVRIVLSDRFLTQKTLTKEKTIGLTAIKNVSFIRLPITGGVILVESDDGKIKIPLTVTNIHDLVTRLENICRGVIPVCSTGEATWRRIHFFSRKSDAVSRRVKHAFIPLMKICIAMLPVSVVTGALFWNMSIVPLIFWGIAGPLFPMLSYAIADILLRKQETTIIERGTGYNDNYDEKKIYVRCGLFFFFLYLIAGIIYKAIVL